MTVAQAQTVEEAALASAFLRGRLPVGGDRTAATGVGFN